jgi:hypothetical protein
MPAQGAKHHPLLQLFRQFWTALHHSLVGPPPAAVLPADPPAATPGPYEPLQRVRLSDGVGHTLFEEYATHRAAERGDEETGWVLLGLREKDEAVVLATLPAGAERDAGVAHVWFNSTAQAVGSRIVRQLDRRLTTLGVVHTHPGTLRHPSSGDFEGDSVWVQRLRGKEGVFGIGTADPKSKADRLFARQPRPHVQCLGPLSFCWYALREGDRRYRKVPVELTIGPDLARPLHEVWPIVEAHAERLERLFCQQAGMACDVAASAGSKALVVTVPLAEPNSAVRVLLRPKEVRYFVVRDGDVFAVDGPSEHIDQGVYLLMAELAAQS